jgi:hypothetical protein
MAHGDHHVTQSLLEIQFLHNSSRETTCMGTRNEHVMMRPSKRIMVNKTFARLPRTIEDMNESSLWKAHLFLDMSLIYYSLLRWVLEDLAFFPNNTFCAACSTSPL